MLKKYFLTTLTATAITNAFFTTPTYSMEDVALGGVMKPHRYTSELLTCRMLKAGGFKHQNHYPLYNITGSWKTLGLENAQEIIDDSRSSESDRKVAFNYLSHAIEEKIAARFTEVQDGADVFSIMQPFSMYSVGQNEEIVSIVSLLAKVTLWDTRMDPEQPTQFNSILQKIFDYKESGFATISPYEHYLRKVDDLLQQALNVQNYLIGVFSTEEHAVNSNELTIAHPKRMKSILLAHQARVKELQFLKRKESRSVREGRRDPDPEQLLLKASYELSEQASGQASAQSYLMQRIKLIHDDKYSPTGDVEDDKTILLGLLKRYYGNSPETSPVKRAKVSQETSSKKYLIPGSVPTPSSGKSYIGKLLEKIHERDEKDSIVSMEVDPIISHQVDLSLGDALPSSHVLTPEHLSAGQKAIITFMLKTGESNLEAIVERAGCTMAQVKNFKTRNYEVLKINPYHTGEVDINTLNVAEIKEKRTNREPGFRTLVEIVATLNVSWGQAEYVLSRKVKNDSKKRKSESPDSEKTNFDDDH